MTHIPRQQADPDALAAVERAAQGYKRAKARRDEVRGQVRRLVLDYLAAADGRTATERDWLQLVHFNRGPHFADSVKHQWSQEPTPGALLMSQAPAVLDWVDAEWDAVRLAAPDQIAAARAAGVSVARLVKLYGMSRPTVLGILKSKGFEVGPEPEALTRAREERG